MRAAAILAVLGMACTTNSERNDAPPETSGDVDIAVVEKNASERGVACGTKPVIGRGAVPDGVRVIVELDMTSVKPVPLRSFEAMARLKALEHCGTGVKLLRATEAELGYVEAAAVVFEEIPDAGV